MIPTPEAPVFDRISAALRHLLLLIAPALLLAALAILKAVTDAGGVLTDVDWGSAAAAGVLGAAGWLTLYLTPLTRQYGVGSSGGLDDTGHAHIQVPVAVALSLVIATFVLLPVTAHAVHRADGFTSTSDTSPVSRSWT